MRKGETKENGEKHVSFNTSMSAPLLHEGIRRDEFKLLPRSSTPNPDKKINKKRIVTLRHGDSLENDRLMYPYILSYYEGEQSGTEGQARCRSSAHKSLQGNPDIAAMSVVSMYHSADNLDSEMDTEQDLPKRVVPRISIPESSLESQDCDCEVLVNHNESSHKNGEYPKRDSVTCPKPTIFFNDGMRSVDFILVWDALDENASTESAYQKRKIFETNLLEDGLELEYVPEEINGLNFVKIHAPREVLRRYGEILKLRMPMRKELCKEPKEFRQNPRMAFIRQIPAMQQIQTKTSTLMKEINTQWDKLRSLVLVDPEKFPEKSQRFTAIYSRDREYLFDIDSPCFFTPAVHSRIVQFILDRQRFSDNDRDDFAFGVERLLNERVYTAAYPLHDYT